LLQNGEQKRFPTTGSYQYTHETNRHKTTEKRRKMAINRNQASPTTTHFLLDNKSRPFILSLHW
jgi:hypothetical protein